MRHRTENILLHALLLMLLPFHLCADSSTSIGYNFEPSDSHLESSDTRDLFKDRRKDKIIKEPSNQVLKIAFCVTGQLARLEVYSKIKNIINANADVGNIAHMFVFLDNEVENVRQTYWTYNYSTSVYGDHSSDQLKDLIDSKIDKQYANRTRTWVRLEPPPRYDFEIFWNESVPVTEKKFAGHDGPKDNFESAESRFQNNMRWMSGLRECVKWVQEMELELGMFYDIVVRLREDSFALAPWIFTPQKYLGVLTSLDLGSSKGVNDHNFAIDRKWADDYFRGLVEDYYFNHTKIAKWNNPEQHLLQVAVEYNIEIRTLNICELPLVPLRGLYNNTHWRVHPLYVRYLRDSCPVQPENKKIINPRNKNINNNKSNNQNNNKNENKNNRRRLSVYKNAHKNLNKKSADNIYEIGIDSHGNEICCPSMWRNLIKTHSVNIQI